MADARETAEAPYQPRHHARTDPGRLAFRMLATGEDVTFGQLEARANRGANLLRAAGARPGEHIVILMENRREFLEICFAADRCGIYYTTVSTHLLPDEICFIAADSGARILIASDGLTDLAAAVAGRLDPGVRRFMVGRAAPGFESWDAAAAGQPETPIPDETQGLDMLYSSGTTGRPKGIKWPLSGEPPGRRTMLVDLLTRLFGYDRDTRYLCPAPLYHAAPLRHSMVTIRMGGTAYVMAKFDPEAALAAIEAERITHSQWVPTMFVRLLRLPEARRAAFDNSSMRMVVHAAAPCPVEVKRQMMAWWGPIIHEY